MAKQSGSTKTPTSDYVNDFDTELYIKKYCSPTKLNPDSGTVPVYVLDQLHKIFSSGKIKGRRLLDVGTGPSIESVISASDHVEEIYLSDLVTSNLDVLTDWQKPTKPRRDLDVVACQYVLNKQGSTTDVETKMDKLRSQVRAILPIDVTKDAPLQDGAGVTTFDVITSKFCLEAAGKTVDDYRRNAKNTMSLLKPGGHFVLFEILESKGYPLGAFNFLDIFLKKEDVERAFEDAGGCDITCISHPVLDKIKNETRIVCTIDGKRKQDAE